MMRPLNSLHPLLICLLFGVNCFVGLANPVLAGQLFVADRLNNNVYRYEADGTFLGAVLADTQLLDQPTGVAVSPDLTKLFVSSFQNGTVLRYDYNAGTGTATNPTIFADGLASPNAILFSPGGETIYVSNLGGGGVARFHADGTSAGPAVDGVVGGGSIFQFSGLAWAPSGELLVAGFQDFPAGTSGAVARSNAAITTLGDFIGPATSLNGASGLLVHDGALYASSMFASNIQKFDVTTGAPDASFNITGLSFPQALVPAPDGNGFLAGILGFANGEGSVVRYDYAGNSLGAFAIPTAESFSEATALAMIELPFPGDADRSGLVDFTDLGIVLNHYEQAGTFAEGDFNYSGVVDFIDLGILLNNYEQSAPTMTAAAAVPEPDALLICCAGVLGALLAARRANVSAALSVWQQPRSVAPGAAGFDLTNSQVVGK